MPTAQEQMMGQMVFGLIFVLISLLLVLVASVITAPGLAWLGRTLHLRPISGSAALKSVLLANLVCYGLQASCGFSFGLTMGSIRAMDTAPNPSFPSRGIDPMFAFPPIFHFYLLVLDLGVTAAIFTRTIRDRQEPEAEVEGMSYRDAFALAAAYRVLLFVVTLLLTIPIVYLVYNFELTRFVANALRG